MLSPALRFDLANGLTVDQLTTQGVSSGNSKHRVHGLPFSTPEEMFAAQRTGMPHFDLDALTRSGTALRSHNRGPTSATAVNFFLPHSKVTAHQLIAAVKRVDVSHVRSAGVTPSAVFDFDNTLIGGDVFQDFVALLIQRTELPEANAARCAKLFVELAEGKVDALSLRGESTNGILMRALAMVDAKKLSLSNAFFLVIGALAGVYETKVTAVAEELFTKGFNGKPPYRTKFFGHGRYGASADALVKALRHAHIDSHIITLGIPTVARVGARFIGIPPDHVHGFELEVIHGIITGRAVDARVIGKNKVCERMISKKPLFCFGDSLNSDTPMLSLAQTRAFAVEPGIDFQTHIKKNGADVTWLTYKS